MPIYLSVNWWNGSLCPHESVISFLARFCELNSITLKKCQDFFGCQFHENYPLTVEEIRRLSASLNEPLPVAQTVFAPSVTLDRCGGYSPSRRGRDLHWVHYCEECAKLGYHSYLHEAEWLEKCPFHGSNLKTASTSAYSGSSMARRMAALKYVMQAICKKWPRSDRDLCLSISQQGNFEPLANWIKRARSAANRFSGSELWQSRGAGVDRGISMAQAVGQLRTLEPMPKILEPLFAELGEQWRVEIRRFSEQARRELADLKSPLEFWTIFDFYKRIGAFSTNPPPFVVRLRAAQELIQAEHSSCRCQWRLTRGGWESHWLRVPPGERPYLADECPYDFALKELEVGWGRVDLVLSRRKLEEERLWLVKLSRDMFDAGLISYTEDAKLSPEGYLYLDHEYWPGCEWVHDSPLSDLLNTAAEFEVELAFSALIAWLDGIDDGLEPGYRHDPGKCVRLNETAEGLALVKWTRV